MREYVHDHVTPNIWFLRCADLKHINYYVWGVIERETNKFVHTTKDSLKDAAGDGMANINKEHLINICNRFRRRMEALTEDF